MPKPGDGITIKVGGREYRTVIDKNGIQRFIGNPIIDRLYDAGHINMNLLALDYQKGAFTQREYAEFHMMLGYSVSGFTDLSAFRDLEIENPLWALN